MRARSVLRSLLDVNAGAYVAGALSFAEAFLQVARPVSLPVNLDIVLTKACNLRCRFCISYGSLRGERWMPFDLYERIAGQLFPRAHTVSFCSGGEPFLYPRIRDALMLAAKNRMHAIVVSNGMLIGRDTARWIVEDQSIKELKISMDGATRATLEGIRCGANFEKLLANIETLADLKARRGALFPSLMARYTVMKSNAEELPDMVGLCSRYHLERLDVSYLNVAEGMDFGESLFNHPELAEKVFSKARRRAGELGVELRLPPLVGKDSAKRRCLHPWQFCQIDTDGSIRFCYKAWRQRIGFFHEGFRSVWQGDRYAKLRRTLLSDAPFFPYCRHCSVLRGFNHESSHNQTLHRDAYTIPELMDLQVPFNRRPEESLRAFRGSTPD